MDEQDIANDTNSKVFNKSAVTIAYIIDTDQFEDDYGFPFPTINGLRHGSTITLFLEFTCLSEVKFEDLDIGSSVDLENLTVGYSHDGYYSDTYDKGLWRHHLNRDECIPHVGIKTYFMSGEAAAPDPPQGTHYYGGPSAKNIGVVANTSLIFSGAGAKPNVLKHSVLSSIPAFSALRVSALLSAHCPSSQPRNLQR